MEKVKSGYDYVSSLPAYRENKDFCRQQVFIAIRKLQPCTDKQIAEYLNWPINRVTGRRGELVESGIIVMDRKDKDTATDRLVSFWQIKPLNFQPKLF